MSRRRIFVSYPSQFRLETSALVRRLRAQGFQVFWDENIPPGTTWAEYLDKTIVTSDIVLYLVTKDTESSFWQREEIEWARTRANRAGVVIIPVLVDGASAHFGIASLQSLEATVAGGWDDVVERLRAFTATDSLEFPDTIRIDRPSFGPLRAALQPWVRGMATDQTVSDIASRIFDWLDLLLQETAASETHVHLSHTRRLLDSLYVLSAGDAASRIEPAWRLDSAEDYFLATFAVVLHNLFWVKALPKCPKLSRATLLERARNSRERTQILLEDLRRAVGPSPLLAAAARLSAQHYVDSPVWSASAPRFDNATGPYSPKIAALARLLRRAEACDVSHRSGCDLIRDQFSRIKYDDGYECFLRHSYLRSQDLLLAQPPQLEGDVLRLVFRRFPSHLPICGAFRLAKDLTLIELRATLKRIDRGRGSSRPSIWVHDEERDCDDLAIIPQLYWAFFVLAIAQPASDTRAAALARELLPQLVAYIRASDSFADMKGTHTFQQTRTLIGCLEHLRPGSQALRQVVTESMAAIELSDPGNYPEALEALRATHATLSPAIPDGEFALSETILSYGVCVLGANLIAQAAAVPNAMPRTVRLIHCTRRLLVKRRNQSIGLVPRKEHREMQMEIREHMRLAKAPLPKVIIGDPIDRGLVSSIVADCGHDVELLIGVRTFTTDANGRLNGFVTVFGAGGLALACRAGGGAVRVVASSSLLESPIDSVPQIQASPIEFSYADSPMPGTENEWLPLSLVTWVTTERGTFAAAALGEMAPGPSL